MLKFTFSKETEYTYFLNQKAMVILWIIRAKSDCYTNFLFEKLQETNIKLKRTQLYRYIDFLKSYELIIANDWTRSVKGNGYSYNITQKGLEVLKILSIVFKK